jgi:hypothetical protein
MQKLSLLVAASVIGLGSAYSAMAQAPGSAKGKPGAKVTIQAPALVAAKSNLGSFARVAPAAEARSAQAVASATVGKMRTLAAPRAAASSAKTSVGSSLVNTALASVSASKANLSGAVNTSARTSSAAAAKASLNPTASRASAAVVSAKSNLGSMARVASVSKVSGVTKRANMSALAQAAPAAAGMVNKSNFNAYVK